MTFNFESLNNLKSNPEYLKYIEKTAKQIMNGASEINKDALNSIFAEISDNKDIQFNIDRIMSFEGNPETLSENEVKTFLILMDANRKNENVPYNMDSNFDRPKTSGMKDAHPSTIVYTYRTVKNNGIEEDYKMDGRINNEFGQSEMPLCFAIAPIIALSKSEYGKALIEEFIEYDKEYNADIIFDELPVSKEDFPEDFMNGDPDVKAFVYSILLAMQENDIDLDKEHGFNIETIYALLTEKIPYPATMKDGKITSFDIDKNLKPGIYDLEIEDVDLKYTAFKDMPLNKIPKGATFNLTKFDEKTLKTLIEFNDKFAIVCSSAEHCDAVAGIDDDGVRVYTTDSSEIQIKYSFREFLDTYDAALVLMAVED